MLVIPERDRDVLYTRRVRHSKSVTNWRRQTRLHLVFNTFFFNTCFRRLHHQNLQETSSSPKRMVHWVEGLNSMLFAAAKLNKKLNESPKSRCHLFIWALKGQLIQIFRTPVTCKVRIQSVGKVLSNPLPIFREFSFKLG